MYENGRGLAKDVARARELRQLAECPDNADFLSPTVLQLRLEGSVLSKLSGICIPMSVFCALDFPLTADSCYSCRTHKCGAISSTESTAAGLDVNICLGKTAGAGMAKASLRIGCPGQPPGLPVLPGCAGRVARCQVVYSVHFKRALRFKT